MSKFAEAVRELTAERPAWEIIIEAGAISVVACLDSGHVIERVHLLLQGAWQAPDIDACLAEALRDVWGDTKAAIREIDAKLAAST
jgi:hypothetical protein